MNKNSWLFKSTKEYLKVIRHERADQTEEGVLQRPAYIKKKKACIDSQLEVEPSLKLSDAACTFFSYM